jgi:Fic family protein
MRGVRGDAERPGEFRNVQNFIGASQDILQARFVPPPVAEMRRCLEELEIYMNEAGDSLFERPSVSLAHAATLLGGVTPAAASANVRKLVDAGILAEVTGRKRDQRFVANEIIRVAHSDEP